jgi:Outer membrane protein beta-barrel domain
MKIISYLKTKIMKSSIFLSIVLVCLTNSIYAQKIAFGVKAGANISNVYDSQTEDFDAEAKLGFAGGAFLSVPLGKFLGVQPEILLSQKGFRATGKIIAADYELTRTTNYVDVPLLVTLRPIPALSIVAGPQYSYLISQKNVFKGAGATVAQTEEFDNDNLRKNTLCFTGGLDINIEHFTVGLRGGWDFQNNNGTTPRYKNTWLQATLGFRFF